MTEGNEIEVLREGVDRLTKLIDELDHQIEYATRLGVSISHQVALRNSLKLDLTDKRNHLSALERMKSQKRDP